MIIIIIVNELAQRSELCESERKLTYTIYSHIHVLLKDSSGSKYSSGLNNS